jgi:uridine kinase
MKTPYIVGITGGSASGKTLFLRSLIKSFNENELCLISQDEYYKKKEQQPLDKQGIQNYDTPFSIDIDRFNKDLKELISGKEVNKEEYTFNNPYSIPKMLTYKPAPIILVEGVFVFYYPEISNLLNLKVFLDAKEFVKLRRRIARDKAERGYDIEDVLYRYENHVAPTYEKYIDPFKHEADMIIPNNQHFNNALEVLTVFLKSKTA